MSAKDKKAGLLESFRFAWAGIIQTAKSERNFKIELCCAVFALIASAVLGLSPLEWSIIIVMIVIVLTLELANSALESLTDLSSPDQHPLAKQAKDAMAGAVLLAAIGSVVIGLIIFCNAALRLWGA